MPSTLVVPLLVGIVFVVLAGACVVLAPRMPMTLRVVAVLFFGALGAFCVFGFAASMEPGGNHVVWRVGYAGLLLTCLLAIGRLAMVRRSGGSPNESTHG